MDDQVSDRGPEAEHVAVVLPVLDFIWLTEWIHEFLTV